MKPVLLWGATAVCGLLGGLLGCFAFSSLVYWLVPIRLMQSLVQQDHTQDSSGFGNAFVSMIVVGIHIGFALGVGLTLGIALGLFCGAAFVRYWKRHGDSLRPIPPLNVVNH